MNDLKPIWYPLAALVWLSIVGAVLVRKWGWWLPDGSRYEEDFWFRLLVPLVIGVFISIACAGLLGGAAALLDSFCGTIFDTEYVKGWHRPLANIRGADGTSGNINGSLFMIAGHIGPTVSYTYYTIEGDDRYKPHQWQAGHDDTVIVEQDRDGGEVQQYEMEFKSELAYWFAECPVRLKMEFTLPHGSVGHIYKLG